MLATAAQARPFNDPRSERIPAIEADAAFARQPRDPACHLDAGLDRRRAAASPSTLAIRWTGFANFELSYKGQIMLLDAYFDRGSIFPPLGFKAADVTRANAILIGHGHHDHMSDAASVGIRTGATIVGAPLTTAKLLPRRSIRKKIRTVSGRERQRAAIRRRSRSSRSSAGTASRPSSSSMPSAARCARPRRS